MAQSRTIRLRVGTGAVAINKSVTTTDDRGARDSSAVLGSLNGSFGMNFEPSAGVNSTYEPSAALARIYVANGQTDVANEPEYVRAYNLGVRIFMFSWKDGVGFTLPWADTIDSDVSWYGIAHHEPEDMTPTTYKALQADAMPRVRAKGGIAATIFQTFSVHNPNNSGFNIGDWRPSDSATLFDCFGVDYYPDKEPAFSQAEIKTHVEQGMDEWGLSRLIVGEYAVPATPTTLTLHGVSKTCPALVTEYKGTWGADFEAHAWWANQFSGKPDYHFTAATNAAWIA